MARQPSPPQRRSDPQEVATLFDSWAGLGRVLLVGTLAYAALVLLLPISGKRTLTKLNAFDLVSR